MLFCQHIAKLLVRRSQQKFRPLLAYSLASGRHHSWGLGIRQLPARMHWRPCPWSSPTPPGEPNAPGSRHVRATACLEVDCTNWHWFSFNLYTVHQKNMTSIYPISIDFSLDKMVDNPSMPQQAASNRRCPGPWDVRARWGCPAPTCFHPKTMGWEQFNHEILFVCFCWKHAWKHGFALQLGEWLKTHGFKTTLPVGNSTVACKSSMAVTIRLMFGGDGNKFSTSSWLCDIWSLTC